MYNSEKCTNPIVYSTCLDKDESYECDHGYKYLAIYDDNGDNWTFQEVVGQTYTAKADHTVLFFFNQKPTVLDCVREYWYNEGWQAGYLEGMDDN